eukprot:g8716.t1
MSTQQIKARSITRAVCEWVDVRPPFQNRDVPDGGAPLMRSLLRASSAFLLTYFGVLVGYHTFGASDSYWHLPKVKLGSAGFAIMYLNSCKSAASFVVALVAAGAGLGLGLSSLSITNGVAFKLTLSCFVEYLVGSLIMRLLVDTRFTVEMVKSSRFFVVMVVMSLPWGCLGRLVRGKHVIVAYSIRKQAFSDLRKLLTTRLGFLYAAVVLGCIAIITTVYSQEGLEPVKAVPLMLMVMPFATALIDVGLVIAGVYGTQNGRGPFIALLRGAAPREGAICVQISILMSTLLTAIFRVARHQRMSGFKLLRKDSDKKLAFFTHVSHEFRTPLSVVIGYTEDLLEHHHHHLSQTVRSDLENILYASLGMSAMVEDLLALFRLETHGLVFSSRPMQTQEFFDKLLSVAEHLARTKRHRVSMRVDLPPTLVFDPNRMNQMVVNLLSNAVKFTPTGGEIKIDAMLAGRSEPRSKSGSDCNSGVDGISPGARQQPVVHEANFASTTSNITSLSNKRLSFTRVLRTFADSSTGKRSRTSSYGDGSSGANSTRPSFSTVQNSRGFNVDNNFNNGLVVDMDGSNGLLASLGRRRRRPRSRGTMRCCEEDGNITAGGVGETPRMAPPPPPPAAAAAAPVGGVAYPAAPTLADGGHGSQDMLMVISVTDSGPGIPPADVARLFERFFRADNTGEEGTGLGLTICQHIATSLGGHIKVSSSVGVGSTFTVTVPVVIPARHTTPTTAAAAAATAASPETTMAAAGRRERPELHLLPSPLLRDASTDNARPASWRFSGRSDMSSPAPTEQGPGSAVDDGGIGGESGESQEGEGAACGIGRPRTEAGANDERSGELSPLEELEEGRRGERDGTPGSEESQGSAVVVATARVGDVSREARQAGGDGGIGTAAVAPTALDDGTGLAVDVAATAAAAGVAQVSMSDKQDRRVSILSRIFNEPNGSNNKSNMGHNVGDSGDGGVGERERAAGEVPGERSTGAGSDGAGAAGEAPLKVKILLAEDSLPNQKLMCRILERAGHSVEAVGDGRAALDRIVSGDFDLLVLDLGLPKKGGTEVLAELRAMPVEAGVPATGAIRNIPVIISSGHVLDEPRRLCVESGCNAFTEKPFRAKVIVETVQRVMREHLAGINIAGRPSGAGPSPR